MVNLGGFAMQKEIRFLIKTIPKHPQLLNTAGRMLLKQMTRIYDYYLLDGVSHPPAMVNFKMIGRCNLNCKMCIYRNNGFLSGGEELPLGLFQRVIEDVYRSKPVITLAGGEPLLHPKLIDCLSLVNKHGLLSTIPTNGWHLASFAADLARNGLDLLSISIDGTAEIHDRIRGVKGAYRHVMEGIAEILKYEKRPLVFVNTTLQAENYAYIDDLVSEIGEMGVDGMNINLLWTRPPERVSDHNRQFPQFSLRDGWSDESLKEIDFELLSMTLKFARQHRLFVNVFPFSSTDKIHTWYLQPTEFLNGHRLKCPWMIAAIFQDGTLRSCDDVIMGNLHNNGFWEIWNGKRMVEFRRTLKKHRHFPICAGCCNLFFDDLI